MNLKHWLSNPKRTFHVGLDIYNQIKRTTKFDAFFAKRYNIVLGDVEFNMLEIELLNLFRISKQRKAPVPVKEVTKPEVSVKDKTLINSHKIAVRTIGPVTPAKEPATSNQKPKFYEDRYNPNELPDDIRILYEDNKTHNKELSSLHANLKAIASGKKKGDPEKRKAIRHKMDAVEDIRNKNRELIDKFFNNKIGTSANENYTIDPVKLAKDIESARKYLSRFQGSIKPKQIDECKERVKFLETHGIKWTKKK